MFWVRLFAGAPAENPEPPLGESGRHTQREGNPPRPTQTTSRPETPKWQRQGPPRNDSTMRIASSKRLRRSNRVAHLFLGNPRQTSRLLYLSSDLFSVFHPEVPHLPPHEIHICQIYLVVSRALISFLSLPLDNSGDCLS